MKSRVVCQHHFACLQSNSIMRRMSVRCVNDVKKLISAHDYRALLLLGGYRNRICVAGTGPWSEGITRRYALCESNFILASDCRAV